MKKINKFLFLMFGLGVAACFVACGSDSNDSYEEDVVKEVALSKNTITLLINEEDGSLLATSTVEG